MIENYFDSSFSKMFSILTLLRNGHVSKLIMKKWKTKKGVIDINSYIWEKVVDKILTNLWWQTILLFVKMIRWKMFYLFIYLMWYNVVKLLNDKITDKMILFFGCYFVVGGWEHSEIETLKKISFEFSGNFD